MSSKIRYLLGLLVATALTFGVAPNTAFASGPEARDADRWTSPAGMKFAAALAVCEDRTARGSLGDLRDCVRDLAAPDPKQAEIMDLWSIFMYCLSFMSEDGPDAMYPTSVYEDRVNECLGL
jgi:hypothetical protein